MEQKRAREQPERYTGEETVRGPREERLGSTVRFWLVLGAALGFSFASQPVHLVAISDPLTQHRRLVAKVGLPRWA